MGPKIKTKIPECVKLNDDNFSNDINVILDKWETEFSNMYNKPNEVTRHFDNNFLEFIIREKERLESNNDDSNSNIVLNEAISYNEVESVIVKLKPGKATGIDNVPNEVLKSDSIKLCIFHLVNKCFETGQVPSVWLQSVICPIPKGGKDPYVPLNYRGISLLSTISKIYTSVLNNRLVKYLENMNLITEEQGGFRKGRSCIDQIFTLTSIIKNRQNLSKDTFVAFVDMEKCFDWVDRDMMLFKLFSFNVDGNFYRAVRSIYSNSISCIKLNDRHTNFFNISCGVRQGEVLSPTLFSIMINDLAAGIKDLNIGVNCGEFMVSLLMYADDIALIAETPENLQKMLDYMSNWCKKWRMKVNVSKTNVVHFRKKRKRLTSSLFYYNGEVFDKVPQYKYLGVFLDEHIDFKYAINMLNDSGNRALGAIISKFKSLKDAGYKTYSKLFNSCVEPIIHYCSGVWGYVNNKDLNKVFNRAERFYLGLPPKTPIYGYQGDMGWLLPKYSMYCNMAKLFNRFYNMDN